MSNQLTAMLENSKITQMNENIDQNQAQAPVIKRLLAIFYDSFLLIAVLFLAMALLLLISGGYQFQAGNPLMTVYLLVVSFVFFGWFWTHGGQTLGMRAWKLRVQQRNGSPISWQQAALRFITALPAWIVLLTGIALTAGIPLHSHPGLQALEPLPGWLILVIGIAWWLLDQWPNGWRDRVSGTQVIKLGEPDS
ncbi:MAG: RDD family protein [Halobacteria archaeon]|nr:RDD family protein [Halobacteria archaeon]